MKKLFLMFGILGHNGESIAEVTAFEIQKMNKVKMFNRITTAQNLHFSRYFGNAMLYAVVGSSVGF